MAGGFHFLYRTDQGRIDRGAWLNGALPLIMLMLPLTMIEQLFFAANMLKVFEGGWLPLPGRAGCSGRQWPLPRVSRETERGAGCSGALAPGAPPLASKVRSNAARR